MGRFYWLQLAQDEPGSLQKAQSTVEKALLLKWEILHALGGVCVDLDVECLQSLEEVLASPRPSLFVAGLGHGYALEISSSLVASSPNHPLLLLILQACAANSLATPALPSGATSGRVDLSAMAGVMAFLAPADQLAVKNALRQDIAVGVSSRAGSGCLTRIIDHYLNSTAMAADAIVVFPHHIFSPVPRTFTATIDVGNDDACATLLSTFSNPESLACAWGAP